MVCESLGALLCIGSCVLIVLLYTGGSRTGGFQTKEEEGDKFLRAFAICVLETMF
jgi:hypothetical protein